MVNMTIKNTKKSKSYKKKDDTLLWLIGFGAVIMLAQKAKSEPEQTQTIDIIVNE